MVSMQILCPIDSAWKFAPLPTFPKIKLWPAKAHAKLDTAILELVSASLSVVQDIMAIQRDAISSNALPPLQSYTQMTLPISVFLNVPTEHMENLQVENVSKSVQ